LLGGLATVIIFALHGAIFLSMKTTEELSEKARQVSWRLWLPAVIIDVLLLVGTYLSTDILARLGVNPGVIPLTGVVALLLAGYFIRRRRPGWAFGMTVVTIAAAIITLFMIMYPDVMISTLNPAYSLTIYNAASGTYTLKVMTIVAVIFVPIVLLYQGWTYWVFRKRVQAKPEALNY
jgi:cytochrome d ubiquinol oxidase subunit II